MNSRRDFIKTLVIGGIALGADLTPLKAWIKNEYVKITLLHTNDTHSHIEPFASDDPKYAGLGGFSRRAALIRKIRSEEKNVLLFDSGDVVQGTPYYNMYQGEPEIKLMNEMKYDAMTAGNHEFDNGLEGLARLLELSEFPMICSNYDFSETPLAGKIKSYEIFVRSGVKIGVFGLGIDLYGLVKPANYQNMRCKDPLETAAVMAHFLKKEQQCDIVVCLSHLGYSYQDNKVSDCVLAKQSKNIDIILGGHTHTLLDKPVVLRNSDGKEILICQEGWAGIYLGRVDFYLIKNKGIKIADGHTKKI